MREINEIILHCSATWSKQDIGLKEITQWHTMPQPRGRGWDHVGYHYIIRRNGVVEKGCSLEVRGYHCSGHNAHSIGICMVGGGPNGEDTYFTEAQYDALAKLVKELRQRYPMTNIFGHREFARKACPVFSVVDFLQRYAIPKYANCWDSKRWPHFKPAEFSSLWGEGDIPVIWGQTLDALERLRTLYGKPLVILASEYKRGIPILTVDLKIPAAARSAVTRQAIDAGFESARAVDNGVRVYMGAV
jgi:N-acetylmuramoyl-L-alanine amidase